MSADDEKIAELQAAIDDAVRRRDYGKEIAETVAWPLIRLYLDHSLPDKARRVWESHGSGLELKLYLDLGLETAHALLEDGEWDLANQYFWYCYEISKRLDEGTLEVQTEALRCRARSFTGKGDYQSAWDSYFDLQRHGIAAKDLRLQAIAEIGMGDASILMEEWDEATDQYDDAAGDYRKLGEHDLEASCLAKAGYAQYMDDGNWERSLWLVGKAFELCRGRDAWRDVGREALALGRQLERSGRFHQATKAYESTLRAFRRADDDGGITTAIPKLAKARYESASEYVEKRVWDEAMRLMKLARDGFLCSGDATGLDRAEKKIAFVKSRI